MKKLKIDYLQKFITNRIQENINLDYKESKALVDSNVNEISKDISSFANSIGGQIVYGIREVNNFPIELDSGIDIGIMDRERLENIITSNIFPRIDGIEIIPIPKDDKHTYYVIKIPRSIRAPHQDRKTKKYYKRFNFKAEAMEDYEIQDIRLRTKHTSIEPTIRVDVEHGLFLNLYIENKTDVPFYKLKMGIESMPNWIKKDVLQANIFTRGIDVFNPGMCLKYYIGRFTFDEAVNTKIDIVVEYYNQFEDKDVVKKIVYDLNDYKYSLVNESEFYKQTEGISDNLKKIDDSLKKIVNYQEIESNLLREGTFNISPITIQNIKRILNNQEAFKISPFNHSCEFFQTILQIDYSTAYSIMNFFDTYSIESKIESIEGIDSTLIEKISSIFYF